MMTSKFSSLFMLGLALVSFSCNEKELAIAPSPSPAPASTHLKATSVPVGYVSGDGYDGSGLVKFNKTLYSNLDSIVFAGQVKVQDKGEYQVAELVNVTDNQVIANAAIDVSGLSYTLIQAGNIMDQLPAREVTLGVRIRTSTGYAYWPGSQLYLYLHRGTAPTNLAK
jgi:hypothetical protein